ncbi:MAG: MFS transporter [Bacteroidales bacterium]|nr:MFS transporter [Bacteroidales bacterium]
MRRSKLIIIFILVIWFVISFVTNITGPLMPVLISTYELSLTMAAFLPFSMFLAYGIMSIPAGAIMEKYGEKKSMFIAFGLTFVGSFLFALIPSYGIALPSLFIIGIGMAMLQVIINPLMRVAGGEENFAFFSVLGQLVFGASSFISPHVFKYLMHELSNDAGDSNVLVYWLSRITPEDSPWSSLYWIIAFAFVLMIVIVRLVKFPKVDLVDNEKPAAIEVYKGLLKKRTIIFFFLGIITYVGTEQGIANWMSKFLMTYHGVDPVGAGASAVAWFWGLMSIGCLTGLVLLKILDSKLVLRVFTLLAMFALCIALFGSTTLSLIAFPATGFFLSVMFSIIFSLALNSEKKYHGAFSGILCSGILGGALVPLIIGWLGDMVGLKTAMLFLFITLSYVFSISYWAKPLINNKTVKLKNK